MHAVWPVEPDPDSLLGSVSDPLPVSVTEWPPVVGSVPDPESDGSLSVVLVSLPALDDEADPADVLEADIELPVIVDADAAEVAASVSPSVPVSTGSPSFVHANNELAHKIKIA